MMDMNFKTKRSSLTDDLRKLSGILQSPIFRQWFGSSRVVKCNGEPLVVYHGTKKGVDFSEFRSPAFFTNDADFASRYACCEGDAVMPVYLRIERPVEIDVLAHDLGADAEELANDPMWVSEQIRAGKDGMIVRDSEVFTYVVFSAGQIKSAIGNNGSFDPGNPDITK